MDDPTQQPGRYAHAGMERTLAGPDRRRRRRCACGNGQAAAWTGLAGGVALMSGCHWCARAWVRNPDQFMSRMELQELRKAAPLPHDGDPRPIHLHREGSTDT